jgi:predicted nucleic acid-binding Zn ribbon protein
VNDDENIRVDRKGVRWCLVCGRQAEAGWITHAELCDEVIDLRKRMDAAEQRIAELDKPKGER